ncbi:hypothetical protein GJ688_03645 [Heliobacillus mobilis]|uniref:WD40-like Beta Propeller Repeat n=1 Tax=Heliobacterium mobile TaxID=28064 RepID=A0A6I3SGV3_HELMO|nr:hypothetical protein [Heliobacterium mobile]MTV48074.1 hypothetical protein [Heliobacterium mobile]
MKRLLPGIPFIAALLIVSVAAYHLATAQRFPITMADSIPPAQDTQWGEVKNLPSVNVSTTPISGIQLIDLREICEQAVAQNGRTGAVTDLKNPPAGTNSSTENIQWSSITFSNKKDRIAFYSQRGLYVVNLKTQQSVRVFSIPDEDKKSEFYRAISWNPDDTILTFGQVQPGSQPDAGTMYSLSLVKLSSGEVKNIHQTNRPPNIPLWSPDGQYIVLDNPLFVYELKTENRVPVGMGNDNRFPHWSPDSRYLIFSQFTSPDRCEVYRYSLDTREILQITSLGKAAAPLAWLKYPSTIVIETEANANDVDSGRHHVGEIRPHSESSIHWLTDFDRSESNRLICASPNERFALLKHIDPSGQNGANSFDLIAVNRELGFFSWRMAKLQTLPLSVPFTYQWGKDGKLLFMVEQPAAGGEKPKYEMYTFDLDQLTRQKIWESTTATRLSGVDGSKVYISPF